MHRLQSLRLASYNIQKCVGLDLRRQPRRILQVLGALGADVVVLQEADKRLPPRPAALPHFVLDEAGWQIADLGGAGSLGWHGNAVIWRGERIALRATAHHDLPGLEPRGAVRVEFDTPIGPLRVIGVHLGLLGASRRDQVVHLARDMERLEVMPTVWAGDFNEWSRQPVLDHLAPDTVSTETFRNVVTGKANGVFQGQIRVAKIAQKTDAKMACNTLLLSDDGGFSSKPELEIFADDVACGHGATVTDIEKEHLFYLMARGIDEKTARGLLVKAFVAEVIEELEDETVIEALEARLVDWFAEHG